MTVKTIGLDLAKDVFQVHGISANGRVIFNKTVKRAKLLQLFEALPPCVVGMEACGSASMQVVGYHYPFPGIGHVRRADEGFRYVPKSVRHGCGRRAGRGRRDIRGTPRWISLKPAEPPISSRLTSGVQRRPALPMPSPPVRTARNGPKRLRDVAIGPVAGLWPLSGASDACVQRGCRDRHPCGSECRRIQGRDVRPERSPATPWW